MNRHWIAPVFCIFLLLYMFVFYTKWEGGECMNAEAKPCIVQVRGPTVTPRNRTGHTDKATEALLRELRDSRNLMSTQMNEMRKLMGQKECEAAKQVNAFGGWCRSASKENGGQHMTDLSMVKTLSQFFGNKTVGSFGDGPGAYKREILKLGQVITYEAYDGAPYCEETSEGRVSFLDLTVPQYGIPMYDWILSLEVAEHIPRKYESVYLDNIVRHAREGVVLSWAVPGQGGLAHVNGKAFKDVVTIMVRLGFRRDVNGSLLLQKGATLPWLKANTNVYRRIKSSVFETIEAWFT